MTIRMRKWRWLQERVPLVRYVKRARWKLREIYYRHFGALRLRRALRATRSPRLVIGSQQRHDPGWIPTEQDFLNLVSPGTGRASSHRARWRRSSQSTCGSI